MKLDQDRRVQSVVQRKIVWLAEMIVQPLVPMSRLLAPSSNGYLCIRAPHESAVHGTLTCTYSGTWSFALDASAVTAGVFKLSLLSLPLNLETTTTQALLL